MVGGMEAVAHVEWFMTISGLCCRGGDVQKGHQCLLENKLVIVFQ